MLHKRIKLVLKLFTIALIFLVFYISLVLPDVATLKKTSMQIPLKVYSNDGKLIAEFGNKRRNPVSITSVPNTMVNAILATEDSRFYKHYGVDLKAILRAAVALISTGHKQQGGSTITMQVARNFYLSKNKTFARKIKEILLALKIEFFLNKSEILELYVNKIYFGKRAYGIEAAAKVYYGKSVVDLNLAQMAMIAGLPQAPSYVNPINNPNAAKKRRHHVLKRMLTLGYINQSDFEDAQASDINTNYHGTSLKLKAPYVAEMVRQELINEYGESIYDSGMVVYTTIDSHLQQHANNTVKKHVLAYDKRHGWKTSSSYFGIQDKLEEEPNKSVSLDDYIVVEDKYFNLNNIKSILSKYKNGLFTPGLIVGVNTKQIEVCLENRQIISITPNSDMWRTPKKKLLDLNKEFKVGEVIYLDNNQDKWNLVQVPEINATLVAQNPNNGNILALVGGFENSYNSFNRATSAKRQPGSAIKPFIYAAALENGFTTGSIVNDAPIIIQDSKNDAWRPKNDNRKFIGPTRLRVGLAKSRNLVSIRILRDIGVPVALKYLDKFGFKTEGAPNNLTLALGTLETTPLSLNNAYSILANGGKKISPKIIDRIYDAKKNIIFIREEKEEKPQVINPETRYLITSCLQDSIEYGTAKGAKQLGRKDLAGKTGSTNDNLDAWFSGYHRDLAVTTWMGFDNPKSLKEFARTSALPMWVDFMQVAIVSLPKKLPVPPANLVTVKINPSSGLPDNSSNAIYEFFTLDTAPKIKKSNKNISSSNCHMDEDEEDLF